MTDSVHAGRASTLIDYVREQTSEHYDAFMAEVIRLSGLDITVVKRLTDEEAALLVIGADLTYNQFDVLCKWGVLSDDSFRSRWRLDAGFKKMAADLPEIMWLRGRYPGACMDPVEYNQRALDACYDRLEFDGPLQDKILICRAGDGMSEGRNMPCYLETHNYPQDPKCQSVDQTHLCGIGRIVESNEAEKLHLGAFYDRWNAQ